MGHPQQLSMPRMKTALAVEFRGYNFGNLGEQFGAILIASHEMTAAFEIRRKKQAPEHSAEPGAKPHAKSRRAMHGVPLFLQKKTTVNQSGDAFEQEAEHAAEKVMRMPAVGTHAVRGRISGNEGIAQRLRRNSAGFSSSERGTVPLAAHRALESGGQPLDSGARAFFEPRFGHDFSHVRVHTGTQAAEGARVLQARAYTTGNHIVFDAGEYAPSSDRGARLLAHELAHTVQQSGKQNAPIQRMLHVGAGLALNTFGFTTTKTGNFYTCPAVVKNSVWNEIFTSLLHSDRIFDVAGKTNAEVDGNLEKHMKARLGIVEFASKKQYSFGAGSDFKMNPAFWIVDATGWRVKPGVDKQKAMEDLNVHPKEYAIACQAATELTMKGGSKSLLTDDTEVADEDWIPGDWGYITNTRFPTSGGEIGLEGENIIYVGADRFWGHFSSGTTYQTLKQWFDQVKGWNGGAHTETYRTRPTIGLS